MPAVDGAVAEPLGDKRRLVEALHEDDLLEREDIHVFSGDAGADRG